MPWPDCTVLKANSRCMPTNHAQNPTNMNSPILTLVTGTPTARALSASPPTAKIQLPTLVLNSTQVAMAVNTNHHTTVMRMPTPNRSNEEAKTFCAESNPDMSPTLWVATCPETNLVTARLMPASMKNELSVMRKLGIFVLITRNPLRKPTASASTSARAAPTQRLRCRL